MTLPLSSVNEADTVSVVTQIPSGTDNHQSLAGLKVLVVDDEPDAREVIRRMLDQAGSRVITAEDAAQG